MRGQFPALSLVGAHIVRPRFLSKLRRRSGSPHPPAKKERMRDKIPKMSMDCTDIGRGLAPAAPFVGRGLPTRRPGLPRLRRRGGTLGRPPTKQAYSTLIPNICIQTSHKGINPSLFEQAQSLPPTGGRLPLSRGRFPLSGGNGRRPKGVGMLSRRDRGDRDRCPSAHTGADEGAPRPQMRVPAPLSQPSADSSSVKGEPWCRFSRFK